MADWRLWAIVVLSGLATYLWRALAVAIAGRVSPASEAFRLFSCIAYAMLAGLIARMVILPDGVLGETPLAIRVAGVGVAIAVFFGMRRNLPLGVIAGVAVFATLLHWPGLAAGP